MGDATVRVARWLVGIRWVITGDSTSARSRQIGEQRRRQRPGERQVAVVVHRRGVAVEAGEGEDPALPLQRQQDADPVHALGVADHDGGGAVEVAGPAVQDACAVGHVDRDVGLRRDVPPPARASIARQRVWRPSSRRRDRRAARAVDHDAGDRPCGHEQVVDRRAVGDHGAAITHEPAPDRRLEHRPARRSRPPRHVAADPVRPALVPPRHADAGADGPGLLELVDDPREPRRHAIWPAASRRGRADPGARRDAPRRRCRRRDGGRRGGRA